MTKEQKLIKESFNELNGIYSDSVQYPQLKMPNRQEDRVRDLLMKVKSYLDLKNLRND